MSLFGAIGRTALKALHSNNRFVLSHSTKAPEYVSIRLFGIFGKTSEMAEEKVPERPKRPTNCYNIFYKEKVAELRAQNPEIKVKELAKAIGDHWKNLDPYLKQEILDKSKKNSEEYKKQIQEWRQSLNDNQRNSYLLTIRSRKQVLARRRLKSELKQLDYPIRPKSAFNLYIKDAINRSEKTDEPHKELFKRIVSNWNHMSLEEKAPFIESAANDRIRYIDELNKWQQNIETDDKKEVLNKLTKLRAISSKSYLNSDLKKEKTKKVAKKKPKATKLKVKTKTAMKTKAKPRVKSKSKLNKSTEKSKESKAKKTKKQESDSSSDE